MVTYYKVYDSIKRIEYIPAVIIGTEANITEMEHYAVFRDFFIPPADKLLIMLYYILKRSCTEFKYVSVIEMRIRSKKYRLRVFLSELYGFRIIMPNSVSHISSALCSEAYSSRRAMSPPGLSMCSSYWHTRRLR